jgi:hypothetical protein
MLPGQRSLDDDDPKHQHIFCYYHLNSKRPFILDQHLQPPDHDRGHDHDYSPIFRYRHSFVRLGLDPRRRIAQLPQLPAALAVSHIREYRHSRRSHLGRTI